jgi:phosphoserine phosphatase RsbX
MASIEWGIAGAPLAGQLTSGDLAVVETFPGGALVALIDGLGHGPEATLAARKAAEVLTAEPSARVEVLVQRCHESLRSTRGAAISLASIDAQSSSIEWLGIGNVDGVLVRSPWTDLRDDGLVNRGGTVGYLMPPLHPRTAPIRRGDNLVFATDGIRSGFREDITGALSPQGVADLILERHARGTDDACVVVARYLGGELVIAIRNESDVANARMRLRAFSVDLGFAATASDELATAVSEIARNIVIHAITGEIVVRQIADAGRNGLTIVATDRGPGIPDSEKALQDGYSTGTGLGLGLPSARRLVDSLEISSTPGVGTTITMKKWQR